MIDESKHAQNRFWHYHLLSIILASQPGTNISYLSRNYLDDLNRRLRIHDYHNDSFDLQTTPICTIKTDSKPTGGNQP